jgi:hypothetical protein
MASHWKWTGTVWAAACLMILPGCERKAENAEGVATTSVSPRAVSARELQALADDAAIFGDARGQVKEFIAELNSDKPIPPTIIASWYSRGKQQQPALELYFYDESQTIRGFRLKAGPASGEAVYDYVVYLPQSRNNRALGILAIQVIPDAPPDAGKRVNVPVQKVPGGGIRAWVPGPAGNSPLTICLLDEDGREHACTPLKVRPAPQSRPASRAY